VYYTLLHQSLHRPLRLAAPLALALAAACSEAAVDPLAIERVRVSP
jgi:hypothetical protein